MNRYLFLDIDGVLTTNSSRISDKGTPEPTRFKQECVKAIERLIKTADPKIILHSSWRKLPEPPPMKEYTYPPPQSWWYFNLEWFIGHCLHQGAKELAKRIVETAPYKMSSTRLYEIFMWIDRNHKDGNKYVILDDEIVPGYYQPLERDDTLIIQTDDVNGLQESQVDQVLEWWNK